MDKSTSYYLAAKQWLLDQGHSDEIDWQENQAPELVDESQFLREAAWVVYCSGFRESTVRKYFDFISLCFFDWSSSREIVKSGYECVNAAMHAFGNRKKHEAVLEISSRVAQCGFDNFKDQMLSDPLPWLSQLPYIGAVTSLHLAKNLGFDLAKPDRHLVRLKDRLGFSDVHTMCDHMALTTGDSIRVIDLVLWRYMEQHASIAEGSKSRNTGPRIRL